MKHLLRLVLAVMMTQGVCATETQGDPVMNCALLGTGKQAVRHVAAIRENGGKIVSLYSRDVGRGKQFLVANNLSPDILVTDIVEEAITLPDVTAVAIATPDILHFPQAVMALKAGKLVFLEKPLATEIAHAEELIRLSRQLKLVLAVDYHMRWSDALRDLRDSLVNNELGKIKSVNIKWSLAAAKADDWRNRDNPWCALSVLGTHCIDLVLWMFPPVLGELKSFEGTKNNSIYKRHNEDSARMSFRFASGIPIDVECDLNGGTDMTFTIVTDKKVHSFNKLLGRGQELALPKGTKTYEYKDPWVAAFRNFKEAVAGRAEPEVNLETALLNLKLMLQIQRADSWSN
jgi:predicted dehydrogenase